MVGAYRVVIQNKKIKFDFEIRRNITILRGDSATGKTTLVEMIREYEELGPDSGIELQCEKDCVVLSPGGSGKNSLPTFRRVLFLLMKGMLLLLQRNLPQRFRKQTTTMCSSRGKDLKHYRTA